MDEAVSASRDSVLPTARQQQGFRGGLWMIDPDTNKLMAVTLWKTKEDMEASETGG